jgi:hypothetical protein
MLKSKPLKEFPRNMKGKLMDALQEFFSPEPETRLAGFQKIISYDAHRRSPLAAATLGMNIRERDLALRLEIVKAIIEVIDPRSEQPPELVRSWLRHALNQMRQREIYSLLQLIAKSEEALQPVTRLLRACSFAGDTALRILKDRKANVHVRAAAARVIGKLGYLDAADALEGLANRLASREAGQMDMGFAPDRDREAQTLLPVLRQTNEILKEAAV